MRPTRNLGVFRQVTAAASTLAPKVAPFIPLRTFKRAASSRSTLAAATKSSSAPKSPGAGSWTPDAEYVLLTMVDKLGFSVAKAHEAMQLPGSVRSTKKHYDSIGESRKAGNRKKWTEELNQLLMTKAIAHGQDWDRVSLEPGLTREPEALRKRYESLIHLNGDIHAITSKAKPLSTSKTVKRGLRANDAEATIQEEKPRVMSKSAEQRVSAQKIDVKSKHWTTEEDLALLSTVMMVGTEDWRAIHAKAGIDRSVAAICARYLVLMEQADAKARSETIKNVKEATLQRESPQSKQGVSTEALEVRKKAWTPDEDYVLLSTVQTLGAKSWRSIHEMAGIGRSIGALRHRYATLLKIGDMRALETSTGSAEATRGRRVRAKSVADRKPSSNVSTSKHGVRRWTEEEDHALLSARKKFGENNCQRIQKRCGATRSGNALRNRYSILLKRANLNLESKTVKVTAGAPSRGGSAKVSMLDAEPGRKSKSAERGLSTLPAEIRSRRIARAEEIVQSEESSSTNSALESLNAKELKQYLHRIGVLDVGDQKDELTKALHDGLIRFRQRAQRSEWRPYVLAVDVGASTLGYALTTMPRNATVNAPIVVTCGSLPYDASFAAENDLNSVRMVKALRAAVKVLQERFSAVFANVYGADIVPESLYRAVLIGPTVLVPKFKQTNEKSEKTLLESSMMACMATLMKERFALYGCEVNIVGEAAVNFFSVRNRKSTTATKLVDSWVDSNNEIYSPAKFSKMAALEFRDTKVDKEAQSNAVILAVAQWVWERNAAHDYGVLGIEATPDIAHTTSPRHRQKLCRK